MGIKHNQSSGVRALTSSHWCVMLVIEVKGNIRVLARIRPMIEKERSAACSEGGSVEAAVRMVDTETVVLGAAATQREYEFDRCFGPSDGQLQVGGGPQQVLKGTQHGSVSCAVPYVGACRTQ